MLSVVETADGMILRETWNSSFSKLRIFSLKLDASSGLNHLLPNCVLKIYQQKNSTT